MEILKLITMCVVKCCILAAMAWHVSMLQDAESPALNPTASCRLTATIAKVRFGSRLCKNLEVGLGRRTIPADAFGAAL